MNQRKALETLWINVKISRKKKRKGFYGRRKNISTKNNSTSANYTALFRTCSLKCNKLTNKHLPHK